MLILSEKLINMVKKLSDVTKVPEETIINNIEKSISLKIAVEEDFQRIISNIID